MSIHLKQSGVLCAKLDQNLKTLYLFDEFVNLWPCSESGIKNILEKKNTGDVGDIEFQ